MMEDTPKVCSGMRSLLPLKIQNLSYTIKSETLLNNIEAQVSHPGVSMIMGHNGAGKSLLLKCLHGLLTPSDGKATWADNDASQISTRQQQAMVFQKPLMLNRSVAGNINYVLKRRGKSKNLCDGYLTTANLKDKRNQTARTLSGGEQQRLAIARALATDPCVLLLDEPTANLDPEATRQIESQIIDANRQSIKVVMVTHDIAQARRLADEILFLHAGRLAEHTTAAHFFNQPQSKQAADFLAAYTG